MQLIVDAHGSVRGLYTEAIDLSALGRLTIQRASHVEPDGAGKWWAELAPVSGPKLGPFGRRSEALDAERDWLEQHRLVHLAAGPQASVALNSTRAHETNGGKPTLTPRKLAARVRCGKLHVTLNTGRIRCTVCGQVDRRSRAHDPRNWSSGDRNFCETCQGWTIPRIEFKEVILDLLTDSKDQQPVAHFYMTVTSSQDCPQSSLSSSASTRALATHPCSRPGDFA